MFSTVNHFQMFKPGGVNSRRMVLQIQTRESIKGIRIASDFTKLKLKLKQKRQWKPLCTSKHAKPQNYHSTQSLQAFYRKCNPFVIINIFTSDCNLIKHSFLVTVTDYSHFYFVIKLRNFVTCSYSPTLDIFNIRIYLL